MKECIYFKKFEVGKKAKLAVRNRRNTFRVRFIKKIS
jgi:hypothetical protein